MNINSLLVTLSVFAALLAHPAAGWAEESANGSGASAAAQMSAWLGAASEHRVEPLDLYAIAFAESRRRRPDGTMRPWPWTLNTPSKGALYFDNYEAALAALKSLLAEGTTNIDIGLMGINWFWNGHRLPDPEKLLLPEHNIKVAAEILRELLNRFNGDLRLALARYHSARDERGIPYAESVLVILNHFQRMDGLKFALAR